MIIIKRLTIMSDRFCDTRTYSKRGTTVDKTVAKKTFNRINNGYAAYASAVNVTNITEEFKDLVQDFKECFALPVSARPTGLVKQQWISYYDTHH
jgi:hypothetical protein